MEGQKLCEIFFLFMIVFELDIGGRHEDGFVVAMSCNNVRLSNAAALTRRD